MPQPSDEMAIWAVMEEQGRSLDWLARQIGYSLSHVRNVRYGGANAGPEFRERCAKALQIPASILFTSYEPHTDERSAS